MSMTHLISILIGFHIDYTAGVPKLSLNLQYLYWHYIVVLRLAGVFGFLQMTLLLNKFAHPWFILCVKKHL